jgi:NADPH:quinone reductase-like Zn-dependent oxidoreductase
MCAVLLTGHGGVEMLEYRDDVPVPQPGPGEVLIEVGAAGVNNTDINTRTGWYSRAVTTGTGDAPLSGVGDDGGWTGAPLSFPRVQGADACGHIVRVGDGVPPARVGERVIVATMQQAPSGAPFATVTMGSEMDGAFAQYLVARSSETHAVVCGWTDVELASIPCAYSTAENLLQRAGLVDGERVVITGASGGVGSATVQLAKRRGAFVIAVAGASKADGVRALGADEVVHRGDSLPAALAEESIDVVVDIVGGPRWPELLAVLRRGGRYVTSGAIAGPLVELDLRTLYLKDLTLAGATYQAPAVFEQLIGYIERDEIRPLVHATYPLHAIAEAQADFLAKQFIGKLVLIPPL